MKKIQLVGIFLAAGLMPWSGNAQSNQKFDWAISLNAERGLVAKSIIADVNGNIIITGVFEGLVDFDPGPGQKYLNAQPYPRGDMFVLKLDNYGGYIWANSFGGIDYEDIGLDVATDPIGNIYVTGNFEGSANFGSYTLTSFGRQDAVLLKINTNGQVVWAFQVGGTELDNGTAVTLDGDGNIYFAGHFQGTADMDPGPSVFHLTSELSDKPPDYSYDGYLVRLDPDGRLDWAGKIGGSCQDYITSVVASNTSKTWNAYLCGNFGGLANLDPGLNSYFVSANGMQDAYLVRIQNGNTAWAIAEGGPGNDYATDLALKEGFLFICRTMGQGMPTNIAQVQKLDAMNGGIVWEKSILTIKPDEKVIGNALCIMPDGGVVVTGSFKGTLDFDPGMGYYSMTSNIAPKSNEPDVYIQKLSPMGDFDWAVKLGSPNVDDPASVCSDPSGNFFTTGYFEGTMDCDPDPEFYYLYAPETGVFLHKMRNMDNVGCQSPLAIKVMDITQNSVLVTWNDFMCNGPCEVEYWTTGGVLQGAIVSTSPVWLSGLIPGLTYEYIVRSICNGAFAPWASVGSFTTIGSGCSDAGETNDLMIYSTLLPVNTGRAAIMASANDVDWFRFSTKKENLKVSVSITGLPAAYDVELYNSNGHLLGYSKNTYLNDEIIFYPKLAAGTYYIKVFTYKGSFDPVRCYTVAANVYKSIADELEESRAALSIYPNPASEMINIGFYSPENSLASIRLLDVTGRICRSVDYMAAIGENKLEIDLAGFIPGLYILEFTVGLHREMQKLMITK